MSKYSTKVRQIINFGALYFKKDLRIKDGKLKIPKFHIDIIDECILEINEKGQIYVVKPVV